MPSVKSVFIRVKNFMKIRGKFMDIRVKIKHSERFVRFVKFVFKKKNFREFREFRVQKK